MRNLFKNRRGLGAPVGNLIILVAAVALSTTLVLFATNVTSSQVQKESLYIPSTHIWIVNGTYSIAALALTDTGPTDIVLTKLEIKGMQIQWNGNGTDSYVIYAKVNGTLPGDLPYADITNSGNTTITIGGQDCTFAPAEVGLTLKSGYTMAFYVAVPNRIMMYDLATPVGMIISTTQAVYCTQTLVQST
jgi:hypothetical protein